MHDNTRNGVPRSINVDAAIQEGGREEQKMLELAEHEVLGFARSSLGNAAAQPPLPVESANASISSMF